MSAQPTDVVDAQAVLREWSANPRRAVIFDFNGTLSDDEPILLEIFTELFRRHLGWQLTPDHYRDQLLGRSDREIVEIVVAEHGSGDRALLTDLLLAERRSRYKERVSEQSPVGAGATALVRRLARSRVPMAVVTGAQREDVLAVLDHCEAGRHIEALVAEEDVERGKPDPEGFLRGAALLDREHSDVLVFEDSVPGVMGAVRAGMHCIALAGGTSVDPRLAAVAPAVVPALGEELLSATNL